MLERNTGIKFKRVGPPTSADIVEASTNDASKYGQFFLFFSII